MSKQLRLEEMIAVAMLSKDENLIEHAKATSAALEVLGDRLAIYVARHYGVNHGKTSCQEPEFAGCCTPFFAKAVGHVCPEVLDYYDQGEWTTEDGTDLNPKTGKAVQS